MTLQTLRSFLKAHLLTATAFVFVIVITHMDANAAMLFGEGLAIFAVILLLIGVVKFFFWFAKRSPEKMQSLKKTGVRFIYAVVLCALSWQGVIFIHHRIDARFQPVIEKLEVFKTEHGTYPENMNEIKDTIPDCVGLTLPPSYHRNAAGNAFSIFCMTMGFNHHEYSSDDRKWHDWD